MTEKEPKDNDIERDKRLDAAAKGFFILMICIGIVFGLKAACIFLGGFVLLGLLAMMYNGL